MIIRLPIDIKSLYLNIKNDNESGHTATVATPLKQYGSVHEELLPIFDIPAARERLAGILCREDIEKSEESAEKSEGKEQDIEQTAKGT